MAITYRTSPSIGLTVKVEKCLFDPGNEYNWTVAHIADDQASADDWIAQAIKKNPTSKRFLGMASTAPIAATG